MKKQLLSILFIAFFTFAASAQKDFPLSPELALTSGSLCDNAKSFRYPEKIAYCGRYVSYELKDAIIKKYDQHFGYSIGKMNRGEFKIDHLIPLCAGGSNTEDNLWPQHRSVYKITDPLEPVICEKMAEGKLRQSDAVQLVLEAKTHLENSAEILVYVLSL